MGLNFDPIGGGAFKQALKQIIEVERQPVKVLDAKKAREQSKLKLFQEFKSKFVNLEKTLGDFTSFGKFRELKADLGDGANLASVTLDKDKAEPGNYTIQIDQLANRASVISNPIQDPDEKVLGMGFIVVQMSDGTTKEIFVDNDQSSLNGVAQIVNKDPTSPVRATVIKDMSDPEYPWKLILAARKDGLNSSVSFSELYFLDGIEDFYIDNNNESQNALLYVDGFPIESESNHIKDFVSGVNLHLKSARPDQPFTITITEDYEKIAGKIKGLTEQINSVLEFINKQNQIDEHTDTKLTFAGDTGLQMIEYRLRNMMHEGFPTGDPETEGDFRFMHLSQLGVEFEKNGLIRFKEEKFQKALESDFEHIAEAITGTYGFANQLKEILQGYTSSITGALSHREKGLLDRIKNIDNDIAQKEQRLEQREKSLTEKFARMESSLANLQRQQQYLSATLPGAGSNNMVAQLLGG
ncbi:MAG: flagellar filament capping protein FliD [Deltaproteobacteria bacterium]|nr:flagellar filament capping protein FliD [Deltaproteobacteria bacterium]